MNSYIVVWDPTGELEDGELVQAQTASMLAAKGVVLLPTDTSVHKDQALGAFAKRSWGRGYPTDDLPGMKFFSPIALYGEQVHTKFQWAVRIRPVTSNDMSGTPAGIGGQCAIHPYPGQRGGQHLAFAPNDTPIPLVTLGAPDSYGGWTLKGTANVHLHNAGFFAFALAGAISGVRVLWVAATFAKE